MTSCADGVDAERLAARRGYATLFANLQFSVSAGCALTVTGANGSGKTTLLRIIAGLTAPVEGEIRWQGQAMHPFDPRMRQAVAFNGHLPALKDELSAEDNLRAWIALDDRSPDDDAVGEALDAVALARQRRLPVRVLSQGQRRRIGLARLRIVRRSLWVLDEPLTALDAEGVDALGALLDVHLAKGGLCIAASHQALPIARERMRSLALGPTRE
jgi:heme exporter protein A